MYIFLILLGGFYNLLNFRLKLGEKVDEMPYKYQGYITAFVMGAIIWGGVMSFIYWIFS